MASTLIDQGTWDLRINKLDSALAAFQVAHELDPQAASFDGLACVAWRRGEVEQAIDLLKLALAMDPKYTQALANLAFILEQQGSFKQAEDLYRKAKKEMMVQKRQ